MKVCWPREVIEEVIDAYWLGKALLVEQATRLAKIIAKRRMMRPPQPEAKKPVLH